MERTEIMTRVRGLLENTHNKRWCVTLFFTALA